MNITTASPAEIDTEIYCLEIELDRANASVGGARDNVRKAIGQVSTTIREANGRNRTRFTEVWPTPWIVAEQTARELDPATETADWRLLHYTGVKTVGDALAALDAIEAKRTELRAALTPLYARYNAERWTRVYLVTNSNGHVHSSTSCRNCYVSTTYYWVTELSAATDAEVVAQAGGNSCLTCYASVRELIDANRECRIEEPAKRKAREEREAAAKARAEKAAAKGITTPDGEPLVINKHGYNETIKTARAAQIELVDLLWYAKHYGRTDDSAVIEILVTALAHKNGTTADVERAAAQKRLADREKREARY